MNLADFLQRVSGVQHEAAVYDDVCSYLAKCLKDDVEIPIDIDDGRVPSHYISKVLSELACRRDALLDKLELADDVEVTGVEESDFSID